MKKSITGLLMGCLLHFTAWAALPHTITFATEATYPPFEFMDSKGNIVGFDIDIANALCTKMKVRCVFINRRWDSLIPGLKLGKFDALIGALAITDARKQQVDFTDPYFAATASYVAPASGHLALTHKGLLGKTIGVQGGTTFEQYLGAEYGHILKIKTYATGQGALSDLKAGRIDAVLGDTPQILDWLHKNSDHAYMVVGSVNSPKFFGVGYGIAVQKGNTELVDAFNKALRNIEADATYQKIVHQYFHMDEPR